MICYLDASALVKRYVSESGTGIVEAAVAEAQMVGTAMITRVEVVTALPRAKAVSCKRPKTSRSCSKAGRLQRGSDRLDRCCFLLVS